MKGFQKKAWDGEQCVMHIIVLICTDTQKINKIKKRTLLYCRKEKGILKKRYRALFGSAGSSYKH